MEPCRTVRPFGILYSLDKHRKIYQTTKGKNSFIFRSIITGIATVFGEMGYLAERASPRPKGLILSAIIMVIASFFLMYVQGEITNTIVKHEINLVNIPNKNSKEKDSHRSNIKLKEEAILPNGGGKDSCAHAGVSWVFASLHAY